MKTRGRADGMVQWVRARVAKSDSPSATPRIHLVEGGHCILGARL